jgi:hypothetical protein
MKVTWNNKCVKSCLILKKLPSSMSRRYKQLCYFLIESRSVCSYALVDTQNSQSIRTFLSRGIPETGLHSVWGNKQATGFDDISSFFWYVTSKVRVHVLCS